MINREFLEKKYEQSGIKVNHYFCNVYVVSDDVVKFRLYNLSYTGVSGHFTFYVNTTDFKYCFYKHGDFGGLTYFIKSDDKSFITPSNEKILKIIEGNIALVLLGAYHYDRNAVNSNGKNLFSNGKKPELAGGTFNKNIMRYEDGVKNSLICDYRNDPDLHIFDEKDEEALKILNG